MSSSQFDLANWLRCPATDEEGYRCVKAPSHPGPHAWGRCEGELDGHRCMLPPKHPGDHLLSWYDRPASTGDRHTVEYEGTAAQTSAIAGADGHLLSAYGWVETSRSFELGLLWRLGPLARLLSLASGPSGPSGRLKVAYEFRHVAAPALGNRRST